MPNQKSAYDMTNKELVAASMNACAQAGTAQSGLVIDVMGPSHLSRAHYLKGVLLSKLDGQSPPFKEMDVVEPISQEEVRPDRGWESVIAPGSPQQITQVQYKGDGEWLLFFRGRKDPFKAKDFRFIVTKAIPA